MRLYALLTGSVDGAHVPAVQFKHMWIPSFFLTDVLYASILSKTLGKPYKQKNQLLSSCGGSQVYGGGQEETDIKQPMSCLFSIVMISSIKGEHQYQERGWEVGHT